MAPSRNAMRSISRRQFFRGSLSGGRAPVRPPYAPSESDFITRCDRCGDCLRACVERIIRVGDGGFPEVDFALGGCTLCGDCVSACRGRALIGDRPFALRVQIAGGCLAHRGVVCRACGEACDTSAIRFRLRVGGAAEPVIDPPACTGCGSCIGRCPVQALSLVPIERQALAATA